MNSHRNNRAFVWGLGLLFVFAMPVDADASTIPIDDFADGDDEGWTRVDLLGGPPAGPGVFDASSGAYMLASAGFVTPVASNALYAEWNGSDEPKFSNGFLRATVRADTQGTFLSLGMRVDLASRTLYEFAASTPSNRFGILVADPSGGRVLDFIPDLWFDVGEEWILEGGAVDDQLSLKVWRPGDPEPEQPQLTITDTRYASGHFGVIADISNGSPSAMMSATFDDISFRPFPEIPPNALQAGDANQDHFFDQFDLVQVQVAAKYLTGQAATWGEGDWDGAPGGSVGDPPPGDGVFSTLDIIAALNAGTFLTGPYAANLPGGQTGDQQTSVIYNAITGGMGMDAPAGAELTSINIESASGTFTGDLAQNLGGSSDDDTHMKTLKAAFGSSFGSPKFGPVAQPDLFQAVIASDVTVVGSLQRGGGLGHVDLLYIPEPSAFVLLMLGLISVTRLRQRL